MFCEIFSPLLIVTFWPIKCLNLYSSSNVKIAKQRVLIHSFSGFALLKAYAYIILLHILCEVKSNRNFNELPLDDSLLSLCLQKRSEKFLCCCQTKYIRTSQPCPLLDLKVHFNKFPSLSLFFARNSLECAFVRKLISSVSVVAYRVVYLLGLAY